MPGGDGTGPMGMGPTGWGRGFCTRPAGTGLRMGRIGARGGRGWRNQFYATGLSGWQRGFPFQPGVDRKEEAVLLKEQAEYLAGELEAIQARLGELKKEQKEK